MKKFNISTYFLFISIFTFITIFFFVVQKSYDNLMKPVNQVKTNDNLKPIDPNLDVSILDLVSKRQYYSADMVAPQTASPSATQ